MIANENRQSSFLFCANGGCRFFPWIQFTWTHVWTLRGESGFFFVWMKHIYQFDCNNYVQRIDDGSFHVCTSTVMQLLKSWYCNIIFLCLDTDKKSLIQIKSKHWTDKWHMSVTGIKRRARIDSFSSFKWSLKETVLRHQLSSVRRWKNAILPSLDFMYMSSPSFKWGGEGKNLII